MRFEPYVEEAARQARLEDERQQWLKGNPICIVCGERIEDERCYMLDEGDDDSCVCKSCMTDQLLRAAEVVNDRIIERITEILEYDYMAETPHREVQI